MSRLKICVLGSAEGLYTRMIVNKLREKNIEHSLILESARPNHKTHSFLKYYNIPYRIISSLYEGRYKSLPKLSPFTIVQFFKQKFYDRSKDAKNIRNHYSGIELDGFAVPSINHVKTLRHIKSASYDVGLFADVGIVDQDIISAFNNYCINSHPAPLPQCRGGGALINTLFQGLLPSASVHIATPEIDAGDILLIKQLPLRKNDTYESINLRLTELCAEAMSEVAFSILHNKSDLHGEPNIGPLHFWSYCTIEKQRVALRNLKNILKAL